MIYKFRFYDKEYRIWRELPDLYGDYQAHAFRTHGDGFEIRHFLNTEAQDKIKNGLLEISQWSGLQDKNKKDIYEGDYVSSKWFPKIPELVSFERGCFLIAGLPICNYSSSELKVVGNKYEKPKLP